MNAEGNSHLQFGPMSQGAAKPGTCLQGAGSKNPGHFADNTQKRGKLSKVTLLRDILNYKVLSVSLVSTVYPLNSKHLCVNDGR